MQIAYFNVLCARIVSAGADITVSSIVCCMRARGQCCAVIATHSSLGQIADSFEGMPNQRIDYEKFYRLVITTKEFAVNVLPWHAQDSDPEGLAASPLGRGCSLRRAHGPSPSRLPQALPQRQPVLRRVALRKSMCSLLRSPCLAPPRNRANRGRGRCQQRRVAIASGSWANRCPDCWQVTDDEVRR